MPTQEERLQTVEFDLKHYQTETIKAYGDMALEFIILKGLSEDGVKRLAIVKKTLDALTLRFDRIETRLDDHTETLGEHSVILNKHTAILSEHTSRFDHLETRLDDHTTQLGRIETLLTLVLERLH